MNKKTTQMIKGIAILIMIMHHFIVIPFSELPYLVTLFGYACKICVAIYAVLSGYGYFFAREKTVRYGLKKIWGLLQIYWLSLFTLFIPAAMLGGVESDTTAVDRPNVWTVAESKLVCMVCVFLYFLYAGNAAAVQVSRVSVQAHGESGTDAGCAICV